MTEYRNFARFCPTPSATISSSSTAGNCHFWWNHVAKRQQQHQQWQKDIHSDEDLCTACMILRTIVFSGNFFTTRVWISRLYGMSQVYHDKLALSWCCS